MGITAIQIGIPIRLCFVWTPIMGEVLMANPVIEIFSKDEAILYEGCLSFFDERGLVPRPSTVEVEFFDYEFKLQHLKLKDWSARIVQHELDHMDGILYTDRMKPGEHTISYKEYLKIKK